MFTKVCTFIPPSSLCSSKASQQTRITFCVTSLSGEVRFRQENEERKAGKEEYGRMTTLRLSTNQPYYPTSASIARRS